MNNKSSTFLFKGATFKAEYLLGICIVLIIFIITFIFAYGSYIFNPRYEIRDIPISNCLFSSVPFGFFFGRYLGKYFSQEWKVEINNDAITITSLAGVTVFSYDQLAVTYGEGKYDKFIQFASKNKIGIRVGVSILAPYSTKEDQAILDQCTALLKEILTQKDFRVKKSAQILYDKTGSFQVTYSNHN